MSPRFFGFYSCLDAEGSFAKADRRVVNGLLSGPVYMFKLKNKGGQTKVGTDVMKPFFQKKKKKMNEK